MMNSQRIMPCKILMEFNMICNKFYEWLAYRQGTVQIRNREVRCKRLYMHDSLFARISRHHHHPTITLQVNNDEFLANYALQNSHGIQYDLQQVLRVVGIQTRNRVDQEQRSSLQTSVYA
eukprot:TRINITY_DN6348_c0_g1_i2.p1 TRINITY_DN6348_c0_g1~~TRINITY_DN6348_c0_g1_i2.p1  ORF type:complete len:120 (+),score=2.84 TRINITY_DN6348_c0_g1_i2:85-444(+)